MKSYAIPTTLFLTIPPCSSLKVNPGEFLFHSIVRKTKTLKFQIVSQTEQPANQRGNPRNEHALIGGGNQGSGEEKMVRRSLGQLSKTMGKQFIGLGCKGQVFLPFNAKKERKM